MYWLKALEVPDVGVSGRGKSIANLIEFEKGERASSVVAVKEFSNDQFVIMLASDGLIKKTPLSAFRHIRRGGIIAISIAEKADLMMAKLTDGNQEIVIGTMMGKAIRFKESEIRPMGRQAAGVKAIKLGANDRIIGQIVVDEDDKFVFTSSEKGYGKKTGVSLYPLQKRGGMGVLNLKVTPKVGKVVGMVGITKEDLLFITHKGKAIRIKSTDLRAIGRATQGVRIINLEKSDLVCSIAKVDES